jgi:hypothetical protein
MAVLGGEGKALAKQNGNPAFIQSLAIFVAINAVLLSIRQECDQWTLQHRSPSNSIEVAFYQLSSHLMSCYYNAKAKSTLSDFRSFKKPPNIVLLGSSLMLYPFWEMDRAENIATGNIGYYHRSAFLEKQLKADHIELSVFNWATLLQMMSDSYLISDQFLGKAAAPQVIVLGVAPRDFFDNLLPSPSNTIYFQYFADMKQFGDLSFFTHDYVLSAVDCLLNKFCFLYCDRSSLQRWFVTALKEMMINQFGYKRQPVYIEPFYLARYKNISMAALATQQNFLSRLVEQTKARQIKLILVNMPLSDSNEKMLPPLFYDQFRTYLKGFAAEHKIPFADVSEKTFVDADYYDGVHLNRSGGHKFVQEILPLLERACKPGQ